MAFYMPAISSTFVAVLLQKLPPPLAEPTAPQAIPKPADFPLAAVAHAQELMCSPTLVDTVVLNAGPATIIVSIGAYVGSFIVSEDESKGAMLYRWELAHRRPR